MSNIAQIPKTIFDKYDAQVVIDQVSKFGSSALICISNFHHNKAGFTDNILNKFNKIDISFHIVTGEPNPYDVDSVVLKYRDSVDFVIAIGGGSVVDFSKAVAGMLDADVKSVDEYIEGVGLSKYSANPRPFIAIPTTAGTGAEVTKNSVLSVAGKFKKSFRDDKLISSLVVIDSSFLQTLPDDVLKYTTMDCLTQIIESYTSTVKNIFIDLLIESTLEDIAMLIDNLLQNNLTQKDYDKMSMLGYISGIALANCGLGIVHSFASPLGAYTTAPHGVICGKLLSSCTKENILWLKENNKNIQKYEKLSMKILGDANDTDNLLKWLENITQQTNLKDLTQYGFNKTLIKKVVNEVKIKTNPAVLDDETLINILQTLN